MTDIRIIQGTDSAYAWSLLNLDKTPFDLSGYSVRSQVVSKRNEVLYTWATNLGNAIISNNMIYLLWTHTVTSAWKWNFGKYDIELTGPTGSVMRVDSGSVVISKEITL